MPLIEIAILPCLSRDLTVEDDRLEAAAPAFGLAHAFPSATLARTLGFLNVSKTHFLSLVERRTGVRLASRRRSGHESGAWRHRPEHAPLWKAMAVPHRTDQPPLLDDRQLVEIFDNASYGGQLAIAGKIDPRDIAPGAFNAAAITLEGRFQIGIIDYLWGSGHSVTFDGRLTVDLRWGQAGPAPGIPFDSVCGFTTDYFRFTRMAPAAPLSGGRLWHAEPARKCLAA